jgi:hypothetical protein
MWMVFRINSDFFAVMGDMPTGEQMKKVETMRYRRNLTKLVVLACLKTNEYQEIENENSTQASG